MHEIIFKNVNKKFKDKVVLNDFNAVFKMNKVNFIIGNSGIGKTTLLKILMGLESIDSGEVSDLSLYKKAAVFADECLCENLTVSANLRMVLKDIKKPSAINLIKDYLCVIGLENIYKNKVCELSSGMKRRISILRALMAESEIIFFDEALKGIDNENKLKIMSLIKEKITDKTIFWVSHDYHDLSYFDDGEVFDFNKL